MRKSHQGQRPPSQSSPPTRGSQRSSTIQSFYWHQSFSRATGNHSSHGSTWWPFHRLSCCIAGCRLLTQWPTGLIFCWVQWTILSRFRKLLITKILAMIQSLAYCCQKHRFCHQACHCIAIARRDKSKYSSTLSQYVELCKEKQFYNFCWEWGV